MISSRWEIIVSTGSVYSGFDYAYRRFLRVSGVKTINYTPNSLSIGTLPVVVADGYRRGSGLARRRGVLPRGRWVVFAASDTRRWNPSLAVVGSFLLRVVPGNGVLPWLGYFCGGSGSSFFLTSEGLVWWDLRGGSGLWFFLTFEGLVSRGFHRGDGLWFFFTFEGLLYSLHTVGDEVHIGGGLVEDLHIVGDEVHDAEGLVVDFHAVGTEVHVGGGLVEDLHAVGDGVHVGGGLVEDLHAVGDEQVVGLDDWC